MTMNASQKRAIAEHRRRLGEQGIDRYEVRGLVQDKELVRKFARRLAMNDAEAARLRAEVAQRVRPHPLLSGKDIWDALRRSPAVGADLDLSREIVPERDVDL
jgi:hypothetical protein